MSSPRTALTPYVKPLVTLGGECFDAQYQEAGHAGHDRDGTLYYFKIVDLAKTRGTRAVSLFMSGPESFGIENIDARIEVARLNCLRRAFDSGDLSFEKPTHHELPFRAMDFQPREHASDEVIRRFIKLGAYWLGFKLRPDVRDFFVDFECAEDMDYLGVTKPDLARNLWLLRQQDYLKASIGSLKVSPTRKLIEEMESPAGSPGQAPGGMVTNIYHLYGPNSRVNNQSTDNSTNVSTVTGEQLFVQLREAIRALPDAIERAEILAKLDALEAAKGFTTFSEKYQSFIAAAANHINILAPFIPALTQMLGGK
jgi:hypothetical protein